MEVLNGLLNERRAVEQRDKEAAEEARKWQRSGENIPRPSPAGRPFPPPGRR